MAWIYPGSATGSAGTSRRLPTAAGRETFGEFPAKWPWFCLDNRGKERWRQSVPPRFMPRENDGPVESQQSFRKRRPKPQKNIRRPPKAIHREKTALTTGSIRFTRWRLILRAGWNSPPAVSRSTPGSPRALLPPFRRREVSRPGERPGPTVTVRMREDKTVSHPPKAPFHAGLRPPRREAAVCPFTP